MRPKIWTGTKIIDGLSYSKYKKTDGPLVYYIGIAFGWKNRLGWVTTSMIDKGRKLIYLKGKSSVVEM